MSNPKADAAFKAQFPRLWRAMQHRPPLEAVIESLLAQQEVLERQVEDMRLRCEGIEMQQRGDDFMPCPICGRPLHDWRCPVDGEIDPYRR